MPGPNLVAVSANAFSRSRAAVVCLAAGVVTGSRRLFVLFPLFELEKESVRAGGVGVGGGFLS